MIDFNRQVNDILYFSVLVCQIKNNDNHSLESALQHPNIEKERINDFERKWFAKRRGDPFCSSRISSFIGCN